MNRGQLLASEGFRSVEELAYVGPTESGGDRGFDGCTPSENF